MLINNVYILAPQIWGAFFVINFSVCAPKNHKIYFVLHLLCFIFVINYKNRLIVPIFVNIQKPTNIMSVIDTLKSCDKTAFSFEVLPPVKGTGTSKLFGNIERLMDFKPKYINITTHHSEPVYTDMGDGTYKRATIRRRPGTVAVATAIHHRFGHRGYFCRTSAVWWFVGVMDLPWPDSSRYRMSVCPAHFDPCHSGRRACIRSQTRYPHQRKQNP